MVVVSTQVAPEAKASGNFLFYIFLLLLSSTLKKSPACLICMTVSIAVISRFFSPSSRKRKDEKKTVVICWGLTLLQCPNEAIVQANKERRVFFGNSNFEVKLGEKKLQKKKAPSHTFFKAPSSFFSFRGLDFWEKKKQKMTTYNKKKPCCFPAFFLLPSISKKSEEG